MIEVDTSQNTSFSKQLTGLQIAVDSTSLGVAEECLRKYYLSIICGWQPRVTSVHLTFGILFHSGVELYYKEKFAGKDHEGALRASLGWALNKTWNKELGRPWISDSSTKNRFTLVRTLVWYLDQFGENDPLETVTLADGSPAVEVRFQFDSGIVYESTGEGVVFCGHLDRIASLNGELYIPDVKSTEHGLDASYFARYSPDIQFSMYTLAGRVAFAKPVKGVICDAAQTLVGGTRFRRGPVTRSEDQISEWLEDRKVTLKRMETAALERHWPQNPKACHSMGGCQFRAVCARPPGAREQWLRADYGKRIWDPLTRRGDV